MTAPSPDLRPWVDLSPYDTTVAELVAGAVDTVAARLPGWVPAETDIGVVLIEAFATVIDQLVWAVNRAPNQYLAALLEFCGATRSRGVQAEVTAAVVANDTEGGHVLPAGTKFSIELHDGTTAIFTSLAAATVLETASSVNVVLRADEPSAAPNGTPSRTRIVPINAPAWVNDAWLLSSVAAGADPDSPYTFLARASQRMLRCNSTFVRDGDLEAFALEWPAVHRARCLGLWDGTHGRAPGGDLGHTTLIVAGTAATDIGATSRAALQAALQAGSPAHLNVHVKTPTTIPIDVTVEVIPRGGYSNAQVTADITTQLASWLNPDVWQWGAPVYPGDVYSIVGNAQTVDHIGVVTAPVDITGFEPDELPTLGTVTVSFTS